MYHAHHCSPGNASGWGHHLDALLYFRNLPSEPRSCNSHRCPASSFGLLCIQAASTLYIRKFSNPLSCAGVFFFTGTLFSLALFCSTGKNAAFSVFFSALLTGCMHGVNLIQVCMIPPFFKKQGNVSTVSGVLNSCTYIGSATSTYGIAVLSDRIGWSSTLLIWVLLTFAGTLICIACARPWRKKFL